MFLEWDWRTALIVAGCICFAFMPVFYFLLRNHPHDLGLSGEPDQETTLNTVPSAEATEWKIPDLLKSRLFWLQMIASGSLLAVTLGMLANLSLHAKDLGVTGQATALLYTLIAACSFCGKALAGYFMDRLGIQSCGYLICAFLSSGLLILFLWQSYPGSLPVLLYWVLVTVVCAAMDQHARPNFWCRECGSRARGDESHFTFPSPLPALPSRVTLVIPLAAMMAYSGCMAVVVRSRQLPSL